MKRVDEVYSSKCLARHGGRRRSGERKVGCGSALCGRIAGLTEAAGTEVPYGFKKRERLHSSCVEVDIIRTFF